VSTITLTDVARQAGVSASAVSRVLRGDPAARVSAVTRHRILDAATSLGYRPNAAGRALRSARSGAIALILPDLNNPLVSDVVAGVGDEARSEGQTVLLGQAEDLAHGGRGAVRLLAEARVDAIVLQPGDDDDASAAALAGAGLPLVALHWDKRPELASVVFQDELAAALAAEHLLSLGHRRIALVTGRTGSPSGERRRLGFEQAMHDAGIAPSAVLQPGYELAAGARALHELRASAPGTTGVVVANMNAALGLLHEAAALGVRIPEALSVVSIHDAWTAEYAVPALTTVRMPNREMGRIAVQMALESHATPQAPPRRVVVPDRPELVIRRSTAVRA
jgi:LacI family transcriptional regulator